uniref:Uncharacterized protein n=1 Tax=Megaselia scalaris TaxID=36166 RepID=T1GN99_MEGSC
MHCNYDKNYDNGTELFIILSSILCERLKPQILEKTHEFQVDTDNLFINFRQAYDTPQMSEMFKAMNLFGIPFKLNKL